MDTRQIESRGGQPNTRQKGHPRQEQEEVFNEEKEKAGDGSAKKVAKTCP